MSSADYATILFSEFLDFNPDDASWFNRDRFILSAGHESMLLYSLLHLNGFISMDDIRNFRQLGSLTPGHPEVHLTPGVEATTGPLGQGFAMSVGFAAAEAHLRARLGEDAMGHYTYVLSSDGDLQEPIALGAASLAGMWKLGQTHRLLRLQQDPTGRPHLQGGLHRPQKGLRRAVLAGHRGGRPQPRRNPRGHQGRTTGDRQTHPDHRPYGHGQGMRHHGGQPQDPRRAAQGRRDRGHQAKARPARRRLPRPGGRARRLPRPLRLPCAPRLPPGRPAWMPSWPRTRPSPPCGPTSARPGPSSPSTGPPSPPGESVATRQAWGKCLDAVTNALPTLVGGKRGPGPVQPDH